MISLRTFGYGYKEASATARQAALKCAINSRGKNTVLQRLQQLEEITRQLTFADYHDRIVADIEYVGTYEGIMHRIYGYDPINRTESDRQLAIKCATIVCGFERVIRELEDYEVETRGKRLLHTRVMRDIAYANRLVPTSPRATIQRPTTPPRLCRAPKTRNPNSNPNPDSVRQKLIF